MGNTTSDKNAMIAAQKIWRCAGCDLDLTHPLVMGILNVTPDSFSDGGLYTSVSTALEHARQMLDDGAVIIDVGGESTRPGSQEVASCEELDRVLPVVRALVQLGEERAAAGEGTRAFISVDTRHASVARACIKAGAHIINDISGFRDPQMRELVAGASGATGARGTEGATDAGGMSGAGCASSASGAGDMTDLSGAACVGLVVMHMAGDPQTMQNTIHYDDVVAEVRAYVLSQAKLLEDAGVARERICIDPGVGFGKTLEHNVALIKRTSEFAACGYPLMVAVSRKGFIGSLYGETLPGARVWSSVAVAVRAVCAGARIARVHDVAQTVAAFEWLERPASRVVIALGGNEGHAAQTLQRAVEQIAQLPVTQVLAASHVYGSEPAYYESQDVFTNAVAIVQTRLHPRVLLAELQRIELACGRVRTFANAPRTLDLDIVDYAGVVSNDPELVLPHPKVLERDFVVTPLLELDASFVLADGVAVTRTHVAYGQVTDVRGELFVPAQPVPEG